MHVKGGVFSFGKINVGVTISSLGIHLKYTRSKVRDAEAIFSKFFDNTEHITIFLYTECLWTFFH